MDESVVSTQNPKQANENNSLVWEYQKLGQERKRYHVYSAAPGISRVVIKLTLNRELKL